MISISQSHVFSRHMVMHRLFQHCSSMSRHSAPGAPAQASHSFASAASFGGGVKRRKGGNRWTLAPSWARVRPIETSAMTTRKSGARAFLRPCAAAPSAVQAPLGGAVPAAQRALRRPGIPRSLDPPAPHRTHAHRSRPNIKVWVFCS